MSKDKEWYNDQDISLMLNNYSQNTYQVEMPVKVSEEDNDLLWMTQTISEATKRIKNQEIGSVAIPINLGNDHWTGLVLKKNHKGAVEAHYNNSFGTALEQSSPALQQILLNEGIKAKNIYDYQLNQQNDGYNCGPWTVINLDAMARGAKLYDPRKNTDKKPNIEEQRASLAILRVVNADIMINDNDLITENEKPLNQEKVPKFANNTTEAIISTISNLSGAVLAELEKIKIQLKRSVKYVKDHLPRLRHAPSKKQHDKERKK